MRVFSENMSSGVEYGHAPSVVGQTLWGVPPPPRAVTARQEGSKARVAWIHSTQGVTSYTVRLLRQGQILQVRPWTYHYYYKSGQQY